MTPDIRSTGLAEGAVSVPVPGPGPGPRHEQDRTGNPLADWFRPALLWLVSMLALSLLAGRLIGNAYRAHPLALSAAQVAGPDRVALLLGSSVTVAAVDTRRLSQDLSRGGAATAVPDLAVGGWDMVHLYQLALLDRDRLRPGRDVVVIEISAGGLDDSNQGNRLGVIRPETALSIASLPGMPVEDRQEVLLGAVSGLYRYRQRLQSTVIEPHLVRVADGLRRRFLAKLFGPPPQAPPYQAVIGDHNRILEVHGDLSAFRTKMHALGQQQIDGLRIGGYKLAALRRAVRVLRERGLTVYLLRIPTAPWFHRALLATQPGQRIGPLIAEVAAEDGAILLPDFAALHLTDDAFWDGAHMKPAYRQLFTDALAQALGDLAGSAAAGLPGGR